MVKCQSIFLKLKAPTQSAHSVGFKLRARLRRRRSCLPSLLNRVSQFLPGSIQLVKLSSLQFSSARLKLNRMNSSGMMSAALLLVNLPAQPANQQWIVTGTADHR